MFNLGDPFLLCTVQIVDDGQCNVQLPAATHCSMETCLNSLSSELVANWWQLAMDEWTKQLPLAILLPDLIKMVQGCSWKRDFEKKDRLT